MPRPSLRSLGVVAASGAAALGTALGPAVLGATAAGASSTPTGTGLTAKTVLAGSSLSHTFTDVNTGTTASEPLTKPDDITMLGFDVFVGFQNGVGPQGQPNGNGNQDSTIVEMTPFGKEVAQWDVAGKADGVTADPAAGLVIATVNEDANSSLYTITPGAVSAVHYTYNKPLPHNGGTDAISILNGNILISASAPGTTGTLPAPQPTFPAVYRVSLDAATSVATVKAAFFDEGPARVANTNATDFGKLVKLALTDPDSSEIVPWGMPRFGGQYMLDSQGDQEQIFLGNPAGPNHELSVLSLTQSVDDTAFPADHGTHGELFATDSTDDTVAVITGALPSSPVAVATPCGANSAPPNCTTPNYLSAINPWTGAVNQLSVGGATFVPQGGLLYVPLPNPTQSNQDQNQNQNQQ
jgi:hypothetical protein